MDGQRLLLTFRLSPLSLYSQKKIQKIKEDVKLLIRRLGTLRSFGDVLPEFQVFPGFSKAIWFGI